MTAEISHCLGPIDFKLTVMPLIFQISAELSVVHSNGKTCTPGSVSEPSETFLDISAKKTEETAHGNIVVHFMGNVGSRPPSGQLVQFN